MGHGVTRCGSAELMEFGSADHQKLHDKTARELLWTSHRTFQGWTCSQCEWNYPVPTLLTDADAKTAFDRLAASKFREHKCSDHLARAGYRRGFFLAHSQVNFAGIQAEGCGGVDAAGSGTGVSGAGEGLGAGEERGRGFLAQVESRSDLILKRVHCVEQCSWFE